MDLIADYECHTGEGPLWHPGEERLYWVDIPNGRLFRYDPAANNHEVCYETDVIAGFTIQADGSLLLFEDGGRIELYDDGVVRPVVEAIPDDSDTRFNDVIADPMGRVFAGTMPTGERGGRLWRLDVDGTLAEIEDGVGIANGMGFTRDRQGFYFTETEADAIYRYDYDEATGEVSNRETFVDAGGEGHPDGMTVDAEGYVWSARWDGGCVVRHAPDGSVDRRVEFPARKVSSVTFGGPNYDEAYVTTALAGGTKGEEGEGAGALFRFDPGVGGIPEFRSRIRV
jgi:D-xylonolactonase